MKKKIVTIFTPLAAAIIILSAIFMSSYYPQMSFAGWDTQELFVPLTDRQEYVLDESVSSNSSDDKNPAKDPPDIRSRSVSLNLYAIFDQGFKHARDKFVLNLFPDVSLTATLDKLTFPTPSQIVWKGSIDEDPEGWVTIVVNDGIFAGNIYYESQLYQIRTGKSDSYKISQVNRGVIPDDSPSMEITVDNFGPMNTIAIDKNNATDDGSQIDVLVVYTDDARDAAGSDSAILAEIDLAISETNTTFSNSGLDLTVNLVGTLQVDYVETGDLEADLGCITDTSDGCLDNVHDTRDQLRADLVSFWVENGGGSCSLAWQMSDLTTDFAPFGFSVVDRSCATSNFSFAEGLGHNMAARNDWYTDATDNSPFTHNHGYVYSDRKWRTVMGKNTECQVLGINCIRIPYWSDPNVDYNGVPTGIPDGHTDGMGNNDAADNVLALTNSKLTVANFKPQMFTLSVVADAEKTESGTITSNDDPMTINCGATCSHDYDPGTQVTLSAVPDTALGNFDGWEGQGITCPGTGDCTVTLDSDLTVTAKFTGPYRLTVIKSSSNSGGGDITSSPGSINCGTLADCVQDFAAQTTITLTPTPSTNPSDRSRFNGWSGTGVNCPDPGDCIITLNQDITVTGDFFRQYLLTETKSGDGNGTITSSPTGIDCGGTCSSQFDEDADVTLTAAAESSTSLFDSWKTGPCSGSTDVDCVITMNTGSDITQDAKFTFKPPVANFTASHQEGNAPLQVVFTDNSSNAATYAWDFDNGGGTTDSTDRNPGYLFTIPGSYNVKLTVTNSSGNDTKTIASPIVVTGDCATGSVRLATEQYYDVLTKAYAKVTDGNTIKVQGLRFSEDTFLFNRNITSVLSGGFDCEFTSNASGDTILEAFDVTDVTMEVRNGQLTIEKILLNGQFLGSGGVAIIKSLTIY